MTREQELMTVLMEECAEVTQAASKISRFGSSIKNLDSLEKELGDLLCMLDLVHREDMVAWSRIEEYANQKYEKLKKWSNLVDDI